MVFLIISVFWIAILGILSLFYSLGARGFSTSVTKDWRTRRVFWISWFFSPLPFFLFFFIMVIVLWDDGRIRSFNDFEMEMVLLFTFVNLLFSPFLSVVLANRILKGTKKN